MTSPSEPDGLAFRPVPPLDPYAGRQHDPAVPLLEHAEGAGHFQRIANASADRAFSIRLDRAAVSFSLGDEVRARQWINEAAACARLPIPWPDLGMPRHAQHPD